VYQALYGPKGLVIFDHPYNAEYLLICSGLVCVLVGYIFASSAPGNLRLRQVNGAGPTLRQVLVHCPRQATSAASAATINAASAGC
jgi:hypothetical protein